jgi:hypothetical protein
MTFAWKTFARMTFARGHLLGDICPQIHLPADTFTRKTFARRYICLSDFCPEDICPDDICPDDICPDDICPEAICDTCSGDICPKCSRENVFGANAIEPFESTRSADPAQFFTEFYFKNITTMWKVPIFAQCTPLYSGLFVLKTSLEKPIFFFEDVL